MFIEKDREQMALKGISEKSVEKQLAQFKEGFPFLKLKSAASIGNGIKSLSDDDVDNYIKLWDEYLVSGHSVVKFVPASGAASRMFKDLYAFLNAPYDTPQNDFEKKFFSNIDKFAFYDLLNDKCVAKEGKGVKELIRNGCYKTVISRLLDTDGLNYGQMPKGLLLFHKYVDKECTPMEEHLKEAACYAESNGTANVHFTVSHEHKAMFEELARQKAIEIEDYYNVKLKISFSEQKPSTDTIAVDMNNNPFRNADGSLLFRPGGHGALIENLNDIDADVVFVKNIDNVVPDRLKDEAIRYKKLIAGLLVDMQKAIFHHIDALRQSSVSRQHLESIANFIEDNLSIELPQMEGWTDEAVRDYLMEKLNRPIRVCGVVKNVGEPGGGPFLTIEKDGAVTPQILESSQIDKSNSDYVKMFSNGTHFNPVDLVCALKSYDGHHFNLLDYVDAATGFISSKSKDGKELKALELPGLWNGAMSNWNTIFVEVPLATFNPVKTVNDLLRDEHQG